MAADIPGVIDENSREESATLPSRRWLWSAWTWFGGLALICVTGACLENIILWQEFHVATSLVQRGYRVEYADGWLRKLIPFQWRPKNRLFGDRIVELQVLLVPGDLQPIDDLVPQLGNLRSLGAVQFQNTHIFQGMSTSIVPPHPPLVTSIESIRRFTVSLKEARTVKVVCLTGFQETHLSEDFVQCLQTLDVEQVMLFVCRCPKEEIVRLKAIAGLKQVTLGWSGAVVDVEPELKAARPDVTVKEAAFRP